MTDPWQPYREQVHAAALLATAEYEMLGRHPEYERALLTVADLVPKRTYAFDAYLTSVQRAALNDYDDVAERKEAVEMLDRDLETAVHDLMTAHAVMNGRRRNDR